MNKWQTDLLKYGKIAYDRGLKLVFAVNRREGERVWNIALKRKMSEGQEDYVEDD